MFENGNRVNLGFLAQKMSAGEFQFCEFRGITLRCNPKWHCQNATGRDG